MIFQQSNLPSVALPWAKQVESAISALLDSVGVGFNQQNNALSGQAANLSLMGQKLGNLQTIVNNLSISASQVTSGTFGAGVILPGGQISGTIPNTVTGTLTGSASTGSTGRFDGGLYSTDAYSFNMTGTRVAGWHQIDGHIGTASSSRRFKTNIVSSLLSDPDRAEKLLQIMTVHYNYIAEVEKRDNKDSVDYVGPEFHVHTEVGMIAEDLHEAGFWEFVIYEHEPVYTKTGVVDGDGNPILDDNGQQITQNVISGDQLKRDESGEPIPAGIHYEIFSVAVLAVTQYLNKKYAALEDRVAALEGNS